METLGNNGVIYHAFYFMQKLAMMEFKIKAIMELILEHVGSLTIMKHYGRIVRILGNVSQCWKAEGLSRV